MPKRFIIHVLNNDTDTKQRVVEGRKKVFTAKERDRIVRKLIDLGHGAEVGPA